jgi:hypothetical protein
MDSPNGVIGRVRIGRAQARRIKVIVCHRVTSVSVSTSNAHTSGGAWRASIRTAVLRWSPLAADQPVPRLPPPSPDAAGRPIGLTRRQPSSLLDPFST